VRQAQEKASVGAKELIAMLTLFVTTDAFLSYPQFVTNSGLEAAWMEPVLSGTLTLVLFLLVDTLVRRFFPGLDILEICKERFGQLIAVLVALIVAFYLLVVTVLVMREFMENTAMAVLPQTPLLLTGAILAASVGLIAHCGLEGIVRVSYFFLPVLIIGMLALCLLTSNWWTPDFLYPFWGRGFEHVVFGGLKYSSIFANVLLLCIIYPHAHDPKALRKVGVISIVLSTILLTGFILTYTLVFAVQEADKVAFPFYQLARMIYIGRFIQRFESIFIFLWVGAAVVKMSVLLWGTVYVLGSAFRWPVLKPAIPAVCLLALSLSLLPRNLMSVQQFQDMYVSTWGWTIVWGLPVLIVGLAAIMKRLRVRG
jgi:spore germination protein KB